MMKEQARSSVWIMGFDTHMISEIAPALLSRPVTSPPPNRTSRHFTGALTTDLPCSARGDRPSPSLRPRRRRL
jgi:hypothetical protein